MSENLDETATETLQQRLLEELQAQQRLQDELKAALESERSLRLENDLLWAYLHREHPQRVKDAQGLLARLAEGSDLSIELHDPKQRDVPKQRKLKKRVRGALGRLPGVHRVYHGIKNRVK